jgi:TolB amino-terminal domain
VQLMLCSEAMMMKTRAVAIVVLVMLLGALQKGTHAQDNLPGSLPPIQITGAGQLYPIAVSPLKDLGGDSTHTVSGVFDKTLTRDLQLSSFFRIIDSQAYIEDPQTSGYDIGHVI